MATKEKLDIDHFHQINTIKDGSKFLFDDAFKMSAPKKAILVSA